jgi:hypothetical protein
MRSPLSVNGASSRSFCRSPILKSECRFARTGKRSDIFLATKFGFIMVVDRTKPDISINGTPEWMHQQFNASLKALQTDYVDLYYLHRPDTNTPIEITVGAMAELVKSVVLEQTRTFISDLTVGKARLSIWVSPSAQRRRCAVHTPCTRSAPSKSSTRHSRSTSRTRRSTSSGQRGSSA